MKLVGAMQQLVVNYVETLILTLAFILVLEHIALAIERKKAVNFKTKKMPKICNEVNSFVFISFVG